MDYKYCYILDFSDNMIYCLDLQAAEKKPKEFEDGEELIFYWGFKSSECSWMFSDEELDINHIVLPLK